MTKTEFRSAIRTLLGQDIAQHTLDDKIAIVKQCLVDAQEEGLGKDNKGEAWTVDELRMVLQFAPTKEKSVLLARTFCRGYGSIELIYRWAATSDEDVEAKRPDDIFVKRIRRIAKQLGWRA